MRLVYFALLITLAGCSCGQHIVSPTDGGVDAGHMLGHCSSEADCAHGYTCESGTCTRQSCVAGAACSPPNNPCVAGKLSCASGAAVCTATTTAANEGKSCGGTPPAAVCVDSSTLQTSAAGACRIGTCTFATSNTTCATGCASGACENCTPACGSSQCGNDGCGGSCGTCPASESCGGGGVAGQCGTSATIPAYPGVTPTQIDQGLAYGLRVSPDEKHLLVQRTMIYPGPLALGVVTLNASGTQGTTHLLTTSVQNDNGFPEADFIAGGSMLYYVDLSTTPTQLVFASADGSNPKTIATGIIAHVQEYAGNTFLYSVQSPNDDGDTLWAVQLPNGTPVNLVPGGTIQYPTAQLSPTGIAAIVNAEGQPPYFIVQTATGASTPLTAPYPPAVSWSPSGKHVAYRYSNGGADSLHVLNSDGTGDVELNSAVATDPWFAPDDSFVAYGHEGPAYALDSVIVHSFGGGADIVLTLDSTQMWESLSLSPDGHLALVMDQTGTALAAASTTKSGAFVTIDTNMPSTVLYQSGQFVVTPNDAYAAIVNAPRTIDVVSTAGGTGTSLALPSDELPFYENVAANPQLLIFTTTTVSEEGIPGSIALFGTQGTGPGLVLPGSVLPAFTQAQGLHYTPYGWQGEDSGSGQVAEPLTWGWFGTEVLYETDRGQNNTPAFDVVAATDKGTTVGVIAPGALLWSVRDGATPTRVFFIKDGQGIWWSPLPQSP